MKKIVLVSLAWFIASAANSQTTNTPSYNFNAGDPGLAYNKYSIVRGDASYTQIGTYKVVGSPYLLGDRHNGGVFTKQGAETAATLGYNTYTQQVDVFNAASPNSVMKKKYEEVDSFTLVQDYKDTLHFYNYSVQGFKEKSFLLLVANGPIIRLYKRYKTELGYVSTNYIQSELRQFDMDVVYYYYNVKQNQFVKLKPTVAGLEKEFGNLPGVKGGLDADALSNHTDAYLKDFFKTINN